MMGSSCKKVSYRRVNEGEEESERWDEDTVEWDWC